MYVLLGKSAQYRKYLFTVLSKQKLELEQQNLTLGQNPQLHSTHYHLNLNSSFFITEISVDYFVHLNKNCTLKYQKIESYHIRKSLDKQKVTCSDFQGCQWKENPKINLLIPFFPLIPLLQHREHLFIEKQPIIKVNIEMIKS